MSATEQTPKLLPPKLLPCPFCGEARAYGTFIREGRQVYCRKCLASGPAIFDGPGGFAATPAKANAAWNRRASINALSPQPTKAED